MSRQLLSQSCACSCGESRFAVSGMPITRLLCHCTICQSVCKQPFADVTAWWGGAITLPERHNVQFKKYRAPPALRRGTCGSCGMPVVGFLRLAPFLRLAFVPSANFPDQAALPKPKAHIFYHRRLTDASDNLPKVSGYWPSELTVTKLVMGGMFDATSNA
ncbi:GFA family protein [Rhodanobacter sp. B05]|uniref:GFA family protein n=1 Tax=Rhodanobacter sp. B05 TaxID=1945859 RepID=UPI0011157D32|nr:GFA family protein [Rhodanobacter sp. B05]